MAFFGPNKGLMLWQLLLLVNISTRFFPGASANLFEESKFAKPPGAPVPAPFKAPVHPPMSLSPRSFIWVRGIVYCKPEKFKGIDTIWQAKPLNGSGVKLVCHNTMDRSTVANAKTDEQGYYLIKAPDTVTSYAAHMCRGLPCLLPTGDLQSENESPWRRHGSYPEEAGVLQVRGRQKIICPLLRRPSRLRTHVGIII
ncbi:uncharacterized protein LOC116205662 [Punica granatum]|uniref:Uncharacterized protein LOC116205662 n=1 Tax=Punica granatum TaxID=22663 RepID=A0A6P8DI61_PUNGR|nr:uncharacterized protein LOC116205662 [Punica granatum]